MIFIEYDKVGVKTQVLGGKTPQIWKKQNKKTQKYGYKQRKHKGKKLVQKRKKNKKRCIIVQMERNKVINTKQM